MRYSLVTLLALSAFAYSAEPKTRTFKFFYEGTVIGLKPDQEARIWLPVPQTNDDQEVLDVHLTTPKKPESNRDPVHGNKIYYFAAKPDAEGNVSFRATYTVKRKEIVGET